MSERPACPAHAWCVVDHIEEQRRELVEDERLRQQAFEFGFPAAGIPPGELVFQGTSLLDFDPFHRRALSVLVDVEAIGDETPGVRVADTEMTPQQAHPAVLEALAMLPMRNGVWWEVSPRTVSKQVGEHLRAVGSRSTAHALRHFARTSCYRSSGHDLLVTATLRPHASVNTTMIYAQTDPVRPAEVVNGVPLRLVAG